jgi:hypothetical protein
LPSAIAETYFGFAVGSGSAAWGLAVDDVAAEVFAAAGSCAVRVATPAAKRHSPAMERGIEKESFLMFELR